MTPEMLRERPIRRLISETAGVYLQALDDSSIQYEIPAEMRQSLEQDIFVFSGFKTYHQLKEASELLRDSQGRVKSFNQFYQDVSAIRQKYNRNWLHAEYNFAVSSAQMASHWAEYQQDEEMANLQYRTALDDKVRPEHAALEGVTLPMSDPFWDTAFPPNGWNCRCHVIPVLKEDFPLSNSQRAQDAFDDMTQGKASIFRYNPGKEGVIFPPHHPYYGKRGYKHCLNPHLATSLGDNLECKIFSVVHKLFKSAYRKVFPFKYKKKLVEELPNGTHLYEYNVKDEEKANQVRTAARALMRLKGEDAVVMPRKEWGKMTRKAYRALFPDLIGTAYDGKTPDLKVGEKYYEVKGYSEGTNGRNALKNMLGKGLLQAPNLVIKRHPEWSSAFVINAIRARLNKGISINEVYIMEVDGTLTKVEF